MESIKYTCLHDKHISQGAQMMPFAGFDMPIQYSGITDEHNAVRTDCGVFDVSHMGEVLISGPDAEKYVNHIFTNDVRDVADGKVLYGMMCYEDGGTVDDLLVYKIMHNNYFLVINAANIDKDVEWMRQQQNGFDVVLTHESDYFGQIAVQGPNSEKIVEEVLNLKVNDLTFYTCKTLERFDETIYISRTGYTGEDGFEIYASHDYIRSAWDKLMAAGVKPCGLGCRDTLRFEIGLPLYGDELSADISPIMAGLGAFVKLNKEDFIGREALLRQKNEGVTKKLIGIELKDKAIPRHGYSVLKNGIEIGKVTTGYHCLSVDKSVCMALVNTEFASLGTEIEIQIRKKTFPGTIVKKKFYEKHYKK